MLFFQPRRIPVFVRSTGPQVCRIGLRNDKLVIARGTVDRAAGKTGRCFELLFAIWAGKCYIHTPPSDSGCKTVCWPSSDREPKVKLPASKHPIRSIQIPPGHAVRSPAPA